MNCIYLISGKNGIYDDKNVALLEYLKYYIENCMRIGKVKRIDFSVREVPNFKTPQTCAFIHFDCLYENDITRIMLDKLQTEGKYKDYACE